MDKSQIIALALNILNTNSCVSDFGIHIPKMKPCNLCEQELITQPDGLIKEFTMISEVKLPWMWTLMYYLRSNELEMLDEEVQILGQKKRSREVNREAIRENQRGTFEYGSLGIKLWSVDIDLGNNRAVLEQLQNADSTVESVTGGIRIMEGFRKIRLHFNNPDPNKIHLVVQAVQNWCDVCDKGSASKKTLNKHKESNTHDKMLDRERKAKNPPSDPGSDVEGFHDYDEGNGDNSISLTSNDITAFNDEIENLGPGRL
ncbi:hypothetical protein RhiirA5_401227 [Rhizophagus irregularis]|uniref:Uncharacterized protein n=1 Tax=Rhizophagus irregularis TaxID=588596 RepID=A0A2I1EGF9_9GLOM|nr:hypothetical protein RhiirA5_401227 [Rhizophagus irregularis]PKY21201.1 hypothetical protein RhiirB3_499828 [Rhizophagus irregularis]